MTSDNSGMLFVADNLGATIRTYNVGTRAVGTFAGDGTAAVRDGVGTMARIDRPRGLTSDGTSLYFVEFEEDVIRQGVIATRDVTTMLGVPSGGPMMAPPYADGTGSAVVMFRPFSIAFHQASNSLFFVDGYAVIRRVQ
jgi:hypothetical protein